jgi:hypothetical protein
MRPRRHAVGQKDHHYAEQVHFEEWLFELQLLCIRRKAESDEDRFALLIKISPNSYKRIVMDVDNSQN